METIGAERKTSLLSGSTLACLSESPTINVTLGCWHRCVYCYGRTYQCYPGDEKVVVYSNLLAKARAELPRKRIRPTHVYFCPSCDPFQPLAAVLDTSYELMAFFLAEDVGIAFLTKGRVPERFLRLFERYPRRVSGQIGLTALDDEFLKIVEPNAPGPADRLAGMSELSGVGVPVSVRIDPMWPAITDTHEQLSELLQAAKKNGARGATVSYLFLRSKLKRPVFGALTRLGPRGTKARCLLEKVERIEISAEGSSVLALPADYRRGGYERVKALATELALDCRICGCKNRDVTEETCGLGCRAEE